MKTKVRKILVILILMVLALIGISYAVEEGIAPAEEPVSEELEIEKVSSEDIVKILNSTEVILENETYLITNENISRVKPLTKHKDFMSVIKSQLKEEYQKNVKVYKIDRKTGKRLEQVTGENEIITTGMELVIVDEEGNDLESYEIIVAGDMTQNGDTSIIELTKVIKHLVELTNWKLEGIEEKAGDITSDGKIGEGDVKEIIWYIVYGIINIGNGETIKQPDINVTGKTEEGSEWFKSEVAVTITEKEETKETEKTVYQVEGYEAKWYETEGQEKEGKWVKVESQNEKLEKDEKEETIEIKEDGIYKIIAQSYGKKGNVEGEAFEINNSRSNKAISIIRIDKTAPEITITEEEIVGGKELAIELADNIGLAEYVIIAPSETEEKEGTKIEDELTNAIINIQATEEGTYKVKAKDIAGNETTKEITIEIEEPVTPEPPDVPVEPDVTTYAVTFIGRNNIELGVQTVEEGEPVTEPEIEKEGNEPAKDKNENGENYGIYYEFTGWNLEGTEEILEEEAFKEKISSVTEELTFIANYNETPINPVAKILVEEEKVANLKKVAKKEYYKSQNQEDETKTDLTEYYYFTSLTSAITATTEHEELANKTTEEYYKMETDEQKTTQTEIIILKNIKLKATEEISKNKNIQINLNSFCIESEENASLNELFYNKGILSIEQSKENLQNYMDINNFYYLESNPDATTHIMVAVVKNEGSLTIKANLCAAYAGDFTKNASNNLQEILYSMYSNPYNYYNEAEQEEIEVYTCMIFNKGFTNIKDGVLHGSGSESAIYNDKNAIVQMNGGLVLGDQVGIENKGTLEIEGGEIGFSNYVSMYPFIGIFNHEKATTTFDEGRITGESSGIVNYGEIEINGGTVFALETGMTEAIQNYDEGEIEIRGGIIYDYGSGGIENYGSNNIIIGDKDEDTILEPVIYKISGKYEFYSGKIYNSGRYGNRK